MLLVSHGEGQQFRGATIEARALPRGCRARGSSTPLTAPISNAIQFQSPPFANHSPELMSAGAATSRMSSTEKPCVTPPELPAICGCWNAGSPGRGAGYGKRAEMSARDAQPAEQEGEAHAEQRRHDLGVAVAPRGERHADAEQHDAEHEHRDDAADAVLHAAGAGGEVGPDGGGVVGDVVVHGRPARARRP